MYHGNADDSGSMAFEEGGERIDDMKAVLGRTADAATLFDTDGIVVRFVPTSHSIVCQKSLFPHPGSTSPRLLNSFSKSALKLRFHSNICCKAETL